MPKTKTKPKEGLIDVQIEEQILIFKYFSENFICDTHTCNKRKKEKMNRNNKKFKGKIFF